MKVNNYMAILRNCKNILNAKVSDKHMKKVIEAIKNQHAVKDSKQFPFRFLSAYKMIEGNASKDTVKVLDALETAIEISIENIPHISGTTFMSGDESGSMTTPISAKSSILSYEIGNSLMTMAHRFCDNPITSVFGEKFAVINVSKKSGILSNAKFIYEWSGKNNIGYSTNGYKAIQYLIENNIKVDRIMIFTDCQLWDSNYGYSSDKENTIAEEVKRYKRKVNPKVFTYIFDVTGYGTTCIPKDEPNVALIAGWSDKVFKFIEIFEKDRKAVIEYIENIKLPEGKSVTYDRVSSTGQIPHKADYIDTPKEKKMNLGLSLKKRTTKSKKKLPKK